MRRLDTDGHRHRGFVTILVQRVQHESVAGRHMQREVVLPAGIGLDDVLIQKHVTVVQIAPPLRFSCHCSSS